MRQRHRSGNDQPTARPGSNIRLLPHRLATSTPSDDHPSAPLLQHPGHCQPGGARGRAGQPGRRAHRGGAGAQRRAWPDRPAQHGTKPALLAAGDPAGLVGRPSFAAPLDGDGRVAACAVAGAAVVGRGLEPAVDRPAGGIGLCRCVGHGGLQRRGTCAGAGAGATQPIGRGQQPAGAGPAAPPLPPGRRWPARWCLGRVPARRWG